MTVSKTEKARADYFESIIKQGADSKLSANWVMGDLSAALNKSQLEIVDSPISADELFLLISRITDNTISGKIAKDVFKLMWNGKGSVDEIIDKQGLKQTARMPKFQGSALNDKVAPMGRHGGTMVSHGPWPPRP